ncbi:hypothetical protein [Saccharothrix sp. ST-888]|uniref:hypothetical protein n=1 Tax=Saccharothrix sp. ST-888 TaxID=1427391 RepID=UPI0005ED19D1|nr:hypothetical protein [Saccharothrix sp. ST-888]KJK54982.1 hypothetical protein UK12_31510 [Saccharothrix sp. ST-888]
MIAATVSPVAAAGVLATLHPYLLPPLVLDSVPTGVAAVRVARIHYLAAVTTSDDRRALRIYRWFVIDKQTAEEVRSDTVTPFLMTKYRAAEPRVATATDRATLRSTAVVRS